MIKIILINLFRKKEKYYISLIVEDMNLLFGYCFASLLPELSYQKPENGALLRSALNGVNDYVLYIYVNHSETDSQWHFNFFTKF